jgi:hypothetical protein
MPKFVLFAVLLLTFGVGHAYTDEEKKSNKKESSVVDIDYSTGNYTADVKGGTSVSVDELWGTKVDTGTLPAKIKIKYRGGSTDSIELGPGQSAWIGGLFGLGGISISAGSSGSQQPWYSYFLPRPNVETPTENTKQKISGQNFRNYLTGGNFRASGSKFDRVDTKGEEVKLSGSKVRELIIRNKEAQIRLSGSQVGTLYTPQDFVGKVNQSGGVIGQRKELKTPDEILPPAVGFFNTLKRLYWRYF